MPTKKYFSSYIIKFEEISKNLYFRKNINKNPIKIIKNGKKNSYITTICTMQSEVVHKNRTYQNPINIHAECMLIGFRRQEKIN